MEHNYFLITFGHFFFGLLLKVQAFAQVISYIVYDLFGDQVGV